MEIIHLRKKLIMTGDNVMKVKPNDVMIRYTGRIDWTDEEKPVWVYPCTSAEMKFTGRTLRIKVSNKNNYWDNYLGCIIDQSQRSYLLNKEGITELDIVVPDSDTDEHRVLFFKRQDESVCSCVLPTPVTANAYEGARRLTIREVSPKLSGFRADTNEKMGHLDHFKNGWTGTNAGDKISFELEGSCIGIQYRKTISRPAVRAQALIDGDVEHPVLLDGNFDQDWGDCLFIEPVLHHGENKKHTLEITVIDDDCVGTTPFYLMSIIVA